MNTDLKTKIDNFYISCMSCSNSSDKCPGILKDFENGLPPRGFYYKTSPVDILVVGKNPGHPFHGESDNYRNKKGKKLFEAYRKHQDSYYNNPNIYAERSNTFHKNLFLYISQFLVIDQKPDIIYNHIAHTNIVKCSTLDETGKLNKMTIKECYNNFFLTEIELFKPKVILALGREVEKFLNSKKDINIPIIYIKHPSYYYKAEEESEILKNIKLEIAKYL